MQKLLALHRRIGSFDAQVAEWGGAVLGLALRCYIGWQFFKAGMVKLSDWEATRVLFRVEYHVPLLPPDLAAVMGAGGEIVLPLLLALGLLSRPAAIGLFMVNLMAVLSYPQLFDFACPAAVNDHKYWGMLLLVLAVFGPGGLSLDRWLQRRAG